jgi:hypothetical protein
MPLRLIEPQSRSISATPPCPRGSPTSGLAGTIAVAVALVQPTRAPHATAATVRRRPSRP